MLLLLGSIAVSAQERASIRWEAVKSAHYKVIYPLGQDSTALRYANLLEFYRPRLGASAGFYPNQCYGKPFPVVLHPFSAISNASVSWSPRKMEIFTFPDAYATLPPLPWDRMLAIHENRHVAQFQFVRAGFWKGFYYLFGDNFGNYVGALYANPALLEGDAVTMETALTLSGRGRTADFLEYIRMCYATGDRRDWFRWRYGSLNRYTPDYYRIGYMTIAGMRYVYDAPGFMATYLKQLRSPFALGAVRSSMKKYSSRNRKETWEAISSAFETVWAADDSLRGPFQTVVPIVRTSSHFESYSSAVKTITGRVLAVRASLDRPAELVEIFGNGKVQALRPFGGESAIRYSSFTNCIYWSEAVPSLRWEYEQDSRIQYMDESTGKIRSLTLEGRFMNPDVSADGKRLAAVEYPIAGGSGIVLINLENGEILRRIAAPGSLQITELAFCGDEVVFTGISEEGMGLYSTDFSGMHTLEKPRHLKIKNLTAHQGRIYFTADRTGTNEIYSYGNGELRQHTNTAHGASRPFFLDNQLHFSALLPSGRLLSKVAEPLEKEVSFNQLAVYPIADVLSEQEAALSAVPEKTVETETGKFSCFRDFFYIHSWAPAYIGSKGYETASAGYSYESVCPGATVFFKSLTASAEGSLGVSFHENPLVEKTLTGGIHGRLRYQGWFPVFDLSLDVGDRQSILADMVYTKGQGGQDTTFIGQNIHKPLYVGGDIRVSLPLNLSRNGWEKSIVPFLAIHASNDCYTPGFVYLGQVESYPIPDDLREAYGLPHPNQDINVSLGMDWSSTTATAPSATFPRLGAGGSLSLRYGYGEPSFHFSLYGVVPGFANRDGFKLSVSAFGRPAMTKHKFFKADYVQENSGSYHSSYLSRDFIWTSGFEDLSPRGFERTGIGYELNAMGVLVTRLSADYSLPLFDLGWNVGSYLYVRNMELNPFADYTRALIGTEIDLSFLSLGSDIAFRFSRFFLQNADIKMGIRVAYNKSNLPLSDLGMSSPLYVGFVMESPLASLSGLRR